MPLRIVSIVPSQTELLFDLGLDAEIVGVTKYCIYPAEKVAGKTKVGGTKNINIDRVAALEPTLILANYEENSEVDVRALEAIAPVHITDIKTLPNALSMIREVGTLVSRAAEAEAIATRIAASFAGLHPPRVRPTVAYLIWRKPWMTAAADTFIDAMLTEAGFRNAFVGQLRYPVVTQADLQAADPELIFLSSEPYPFREKHLAELQQLCPRAHIRLVDGELFSWYGSRLLQSVAYFEQLRYEVME